MPAAEHQPDAFPSFRAVARLADQDTQSSYVHNNSTSTVYDVKFYPYSEPKDEPVFAFVVAREVYVCKPNADSKQPPDILAVFEDPKEDASLNSLVWSQDQRTGDPLICFGGGGSSKIKIINVVTGKYVRTLNGHGAAINDLAISPLGSHILASASADHTIRLWNLDPEYEKHPCAAVFAGAGHKQYVLALGFHSNGRYLLTGGADTMVNLWSVPEVPDKNANTDKTTIVYYPHFSSTEVHSDYVDCIHFYGDLILSHAATSSSTEKKNSILLWKIEGFSTLNPCPKDPPMPVPGRHTRSAFVSLDDPQQPQFQRLLTFDMPATTPFYMRFSLFDAPHAHPILVMGNEKSRFSFWDLSKLGLDPSDTDVASSGKGTTKGKRGGGTGRGSVRRGGGGRGARAGSASGSTRRGFPSFTPSTTNDTDDSSARANIHDYHPHDTTTIHTTDEAEAEAEENSEFKKLVRDPRYDISDPFRPIPPHHSLTVPKYNFTTRQVAWSPDGAWCVAVGEIGLICVFRRWD